MTVQTFLSLLLVVLAAGWLLWRVFRRARPAATENPCAACSLKAISACGPCRGRLLGIE
jgi:ABC-type nickel/cobalt efflux system permease component RcnA